MKNFLLKTLALVGITVTGLSFFGCDNENHYDKWYEAAWDEDSAPPSWASKDAKAGYEEGLDDAWLYDTGYYDGYEGRRPQYFNDAYYTNGHQDGKEDKKRR